jgi:hypothetical protein
MNEPFEFRVGDTVEWDSPGGYWSKEDRAGIVLDHGTVYDKRRGVVTAVYNPAPERERLLALYREGKGYALYGDWHNLRYIVVSEGRTYSPHPVSHKMRLIKRGNES